MLIRNGRRDERDIEFLAEYLELRTMLAGTVDVSVDGSGNLVITGDNRDNLIVIEENAGVYNVTAPVIDDTVINGGMNVSGVTGDILINLQNGDDSVVLRNSNVGGSFLITDPGGASGVLILNSTVGGDLRVMTGRTSDRVPEFKTPIPSGHTTAIVGTTVSGSVNITHGDSRISNTYYRGFARASTVHVVQSNINGGDLTIVHGTTRATGYYAFGATNYINGSTISGNVTITNGDSRARSVTSQNYDSSATAIDNHLINNGTITGNVTITNGRTTAIHSANDGGDAHGSRTVIEDNGDIQGNLSILSGPSAVRGRATSAIGNLAAISNSVISGSTDIEFANANVRTSYATGSATGNTTTTDVSSFGQHVTVRHGNARAKSVMQSYGNYFGQYNESAGSDFQGDLSATNGNAIVSGDTAIGNSIRFLNRDGSVNAISASNADSRSSGKERSQGNRIRITGFMSDILGDVTAENGKGRALADGRTASANSISVDRASTNVVATNGDSFARARGNRADAIGNRIEVGFRESSTANVTAVNGDSRAFAFDEDGDADGNRIGISVRDSMITGDIMATNGDSRARGIGALASAGGNYVNLLLDGDIVPTSLTGNITILNGDARVLANRAEGNRSSVGGTVDGNVSITNGKTRAFATPRETGAYASGGTATGNSSAFDRETTITGNVMITDGDSVALAPTRLSIASAISHLFFSGITIDGDLTINAGNARANIGDLGRGAGVETFFFDDFSDPNIKSVVTGDFSITEGDTKFSAGEFVGSGSAGSSVILNRVEVQGSFEITTNSGVNFLAVLDSEFGGTFTTNLLGDDDYVSASNTLFSDVVMVLGGDGNDTFEDQGGNTFVVDPPTLDVENLI